MSPGELRRAKSSEYEVLAEWHAERAPLDDEHLVAYQAMAVVGIVLREIAEAIDVEWGGRRVLRRSLSRHHRLTLLSFSP
jgi:hypothetical protein